MVHSVDPDGDERMRRELVELFGRQRAAGGLRR